MSNESPSDTYKLLYHQIIDPLFFEICNNNNNYCVKHKVGKDEIHIAIWKKFRKYKNNALEKMSGKRLDRHKLASCICGAIIETKPLEGFNGAEIRKNANEILALHIGLNVIKFYMMFEFTKDFMPQKRKDVIQYLKENFDIRFPSLRENICDTQEYIENLSNALYWSHHYCNIKQDECFHYDIWAYSKIFYHLEIYNQSILQNVYEEYVSLT